MGIFDNLRNIRAVDSTLADPQISAAYENLFNPNWWSAQPTIRVSRARALQVPAISRARNIIAGTAGSMYLDRFSRFDNRLLPEIPLQYQPDPQYPASVTWSYIYDSMLFYGGAFCQVISMYSDNRIQHFRWLDPELVNENTDGNGNVISYNYNGTQLPLSGVGSIIYFPSFEDGLLVKAGATIETALELEAAANRAAKEPAPQVILQNTGVDLPASKISDLLAGWKTARQTRATAYLNAHMDIKTVGFNARENQLVEARQFHASELARACNLPSYFLGVETNSMTYSNVESVRRDLIDLTLRPFIVAVENRLNMPDFSPRDIVFRFDLDAFLRGNATERVKVVTDLLTAGIIDIAEARAMEDLAPRGDNNAN